VVEVSTYLLRKKIVVSRSLPIRHPDRLDLGGLGQERPAFALGAHPVPRVAVVDPGAFEVAGGLAFDEGGEGVGGEAPDRVDVHVGGEGFGEVLGRAGDDVDDSGRHVGGVEDLVEVGGGEGRGSGDEDRGVAHRDGGGHDGDEAEERGFVGEEGADHAGGFVHGQSDAADGDGLGVPVVFVGPGGVGEEALDARVDLGLAGFAGEVLEAVGELEVPCGEVFGDEVEDLGAVVGGGLGPGFGGMGGLNRVPYVLAVADADMAEEFAFWPVDGLRVAAVGAGLFAADVQLGGAV
jgi:hypothetical protein